MNLKTEVVIVFKMVFFKENIRLVICLLFFFIIFQRAGSLYTHKTHPLLQPSKPQASFYTLSAYKPLVFQVPLGFLAFQEVLYFLVNLAVHLNKCFLYLIIFGLLYGEGFLGYLVCHVARSLPHFLYLRSLLYIYSFLFLFLLPRSAPTNTRSHFVKYYLSLYPPVFSCFLSSYQLIACFLTIVHVRIILILIVIMLTQQFKHQAVGN